MVTGTMPSETCAKSGIKMQRLGRLRYVISVKVNPYADQQMGSAAFFGAVPSFARGGTTIVALESCRIDERRGYTRLCYAWSRTTDAPSGLCKNQIG